MEVTVVWVWFCFYAAKPSPPDTPAQMNLQIQQKQSMCYADAVSRQRLQTLPNKTTKLLLNKNPKMLHFPRHSSCTAIWVFLPNILSLPVPILISGVLPPSHCQSSVLGGAAPTSSPSSTGHVRSQVLTLF